MMTMKGAKKSVTMTVTVTRKGAHEPVTVIVTRKSAQESIWF